MLVGNRIYRMADSTAKGFIRTTGTYYPTTETSRNGSYADLQEFISIDSAITMCFRMNDSFQHHSKLFGLESSNSATNSVRANIPYSTSTLDVLFGSPTGDWGFEAKTKPVTDGEFHVITVDRTGVRLDDGFYMFNGTPSRVLSNLSLYVASTNRNGTPYDCANIDIKFVEIYDSGVLRRRFVAFDNRGVAGLLDKKANKFVSSSNSARPFTYYKD